MKIFYINSPTGFGLFYVNFGDNCFPNSEWEDFYVNIITDWIETINKHSNLNMTDFRLEFMEGNYYLLCTKNDERITVIAVCEHDVIDVFTLNTLSFKEFKNTILSVGKDILNNAKKQNLSNLYLNQLEIAIRHNTGDFL